MDSMTPNCTHYPSSSWGFLALALFGPNIARYRINLYMHDSIRLSMD